MSEVHERKTLSMKSNDVYERSYAKWITNVKHRQRTVNMRYTRKNINMNNTQPCVRSHGATPMAKECLCTNPVHPYTLTSLSPLNSHRSRCEDLHVFLLPMKHGS
jgi:hypothetical protein